MYSPEKSQIAICLLKSNLESIENELVAQRSSWPELDAENDQKFRDTMNALRATRALSLEIEQLRQENVRLVAKRMQLKRQSDGLSTNLERAREIRRQMENSLKQDDVKTEHYVREYEDSLKVKAERFRKSRIYYCEDEMKVEIEKVTAVINELEGKVGKGQDLVEAMKKQLSELTCDIPEDLLPILGKNETDETVTMLTGKFEKLLQKRNNLLLQNVVALKNNST